MLNSVVLAGNLGNDPEIHFSTAGEPIASFNLAFRAGKNKTGWIKVTCFNRLSEICEKHLHKGAKIAAHGLLEYSQWETNEGAKRSAIQMIANSIEFIKTDGRGFEEGKNQDDTPF
jgi:single-strand DNA-binding protein